MSESESQSGDLPLREEGDTSTALSGPERDLYGRMFANTVDWPTEFRSALDQTIRALLTAGNIAGLAARIWAPGDPKWVVEDLTANVAEYVYTDAVASWLYLNGATVSRATYSLIFAKYGTTFGAGDGSTTFGLPDTRGRFPVTCGTNAACNLGDNDGVAEGSRQPKHTHAFVLNAGSHTHPATGLNITPNPHSHSQGVTGTWLAQPGTSSSPQTLTSTGNTSLSITGNTGPAGVSVGGSVGTGMAGSDAVAHIALGSIVAFIG